jgi:predicted transposase YbfD/YdcC
MGKLPPSSLQDSCAPWTAPRCPHAPKRRHLLMALLLMAVWAVRCGAEGWEDLEEDGQAQAEWLAALRALPDGLPWHDPLRRVVSPLAPAELPRCCIAWTEALREASEGDRIALDGKTLRQACAQATATPALHLVRAWSRAHRLVLGPRKGEEKAKESTAMPTLLALLEVQGAVGTSDALGGQQEIAKTMTERGAASVLALKAHPTPLSEEVTLCCEEAKATACTDVAQADHAPVAGDHGRMETRRDGLTAPIAWWGARVSWANVPSMGMVESRRAVGATVQSETRYFLTSLPAPGVRFAHAVRQHGGIEHSLHGVLEVAFEEDACRIRTDKGAQTFAILRHMALHLLRRTPHHKRGIKARRQRAGWDRDALVQILTG